MNSKSATVDVLVKLEHGIILGTIRPCVDGLAFDSGDRLYLMHGLNENVSRTAVERWLKNNSQLACVRRGDIRILNSDKLAVDSGSLTNRK